MAADDVSRFSNLTFEGFRALARDGSLSKYERIGFPDSYRAGFEEQIFDDIRRKLSNLDSEQRTVLDIGPGASDLPRMMIEHCRARSHDLIIVDSSEMLSHLPDVPGVSKVHGRFPQECSSLLRQYAGRIDAVLVYSVIQYVHVEASLFSFLDHLLMLLAPGGEILIGDIPNIDRRKQRQIA